MSIFAGYVIYADIPVSNGHTQRVFWGGRQGWFGHWRNSFLYENPLYAVKAIARNRKNWRHSEMFRYAWYMSTNEIEQTIANDAAHA